MRIDQSTQDGCAILAPVGELDLAAVPSLRRLLLKRLSEQPVAVICDLSGLWSIDEACAAVFASVANHPATGTLTYSSRRAHAGAASPGGCRYAEGGTPDPGSGRVVSPAG